jgi:hypothetical protein
MKIHGYTVVLAAAIAAVGQIASAHTKVYEFQLSGLAEVPVVATPGTGFARATFDLDLVTMRIEASFADLLGTTSLAHIHCCDFQANTNAGVATQTPLFTGFPTGVTSGTYDHTFDMTQTSSYRAQFLTANGGSVSNALASLITGLDSGMAYFNIHTSTFPSGEIRGQAVFVPEPASVLLGLLGLGLPVMLRRSR